VRELEDISEKLCAVLKLLQVKGVDRFWRIDWEKSEELVQNPDMLELHKREKREKMVC
jgi:hypothetical protein